LRLDRAGHECTVKQNSEAQEASLESPQTHSFIVKIWLNETDEAHGAAQWTGHITHVPGGERRYLTELSEIPEFIVPYLKAMNARIGPRRKFWKRFFVQRV
jgi:hypothetical protein